MSPILFILSFSSFVSPQRESLSNDTNRKMVVLSLFFQAERKLSRRLPTWMLKRENIDYLSLADSHINYGLQILKSGDN